MLRAVSIIQEYTCVPGVFAQHSVLSVVLQGGRRAQPVVVLEGVAGRHPVVHAGEHCACGTKDKDV